MSLECRKLRGAAGVPHAFSAAVPLSTSDAALAAVVGWPLAPLLLLLLLLLLPALLSKLMTEASRSSVTKIA
jgi:hypothetical protein